MVQIPDPKAVFPNENKTSCFIKNVITTPILRLGIIPITTTQLIQRDSKRTMCCSIIRSSEITLCSAGSARLRLEPSL